MTVDFSKAFDSVKHSILSEKLKSWPDLDPHIINWYLSFLKDRKQRVIYNGVTGNWKSVNKGTTQGSASGPYLFNIFLNDLDFHNHTDFTLDKYADDSTLVVPVSKTKPNVSDMAITLFMDWTKEKKMLCNPSKCKELIFKKKGPSPKFSEFQNVKQYECLKILGVTFQSNHGR